VEACLDSFYSAHLVANSKRGIIFSNQHTSSLLGWKKEELSEMNIDDIFTKASNIFIDSYVYPLLINEISAEELQLTMMTSKGEKVPVVANICLDEEQTTYWSLFGCINRDKLYQEFIETKTVLEKTISQQKEDEKELNIAKEYAEKADKSKSEFLANMSHEIRTPLNAIVGFIDILKTRSKDEESSQYLNIVKSSSQTLLNTIEDILDFSKIESGKLDIEKIDFDIKKEFVAVTYLFDAKCKEKDIKLIKKIDESLPDYLKSDPHRIKQVISNLLSNAIKFTDFSKVIVVSISYENSYLNISVKDEGKGIAEDKQEKIFTPFGQEDSSTTRKFGGTGLGLSISSELVKLLGGKLQVISELGVGSEFYFSIPVEIIQEIKSDNVPDDKVQLFGNILLVEDNKTNQILMKIIIEEFGLEYDIANDGLQAIEKFKKNKYNAILMDENMPIMNGIEATKEILGIEKKNSLEHTPIIALTANALKGAREKFLEVGMDEYLSKPLDANKLRIVLTKYLKKSEY